MSTTYTFSTSPGFTDLSSNITTLSSTITSQIPSKTLLTATAIGNTIECIFNAALSQSELLTLRTIFHTLDVIPVDTLYKTVANYFPKDNSVQSTVPSFKNLGSFSFNSFKLGNIGAISVLSYMDTGAASYSVQIVDASSNNIVAQGTFTNTIPLSNVMTVLYQPTNIQSILQISMKCTAPTGGGPKTTAYWAYLEELTILQ